MTTPNEGASQKADNDRRPAAAHTRVVVVLEKVGETETRVVGVYDANAQDGQQLPFTVQTTHIKKQYDLGKKYIGEFLEFKKVKQTCKEKLHALRKQFLFVLAWTSLHDTPHGFPTGCAYILEADEVVNAKSFFPIDFNYASGFCVVEVDTIINAELGITLTTDWLSNQAVTAKLLKLRGDMRGDNKMEHLPGLVVGDTLVNMKKYSSCNFQNDPILTPWKTDFLKNNITNLKLQRDDFVGLFTSTWDDVSIDTKNIAGHKPAAKHYYLVCKYTLPIETVDQLRHVILENPLRDSWAALVKRKLFERAEDISKCVRKDKINSALKTLGLRVKTSNPEFFESAYNVFDTTPVVVSVTKGEGGDSVISDASGVVFYANCVNTSKCSRGAIIERGPTPEDGLLWLHGPPAGTIGGIAWKQPSTVNSLPCAGFAEKLKKTTIKQFESAGWTPANGFAKLDPVFFI